MQCSIVNLSKVQSQINARLDAEYWHPEAIEIAKTIGQEMTLGSCIKGGYRVVYENTEILRTDEIGQMDLPKFIQATDINSPMINIENAGYVREEDWQQYPKGRIQQGEILLEVKGDVKKVAIVPDDFPDKVLVSGTLYKFSVNEKVNKYFLAVYLSCRYGQKLKDRLVSNIATPFISKSELYTIPVPCFDNRIQSEIAKAYVLAFNKQKISKDIYAQAQTLLLSELGLTDWQPKHQLTFVKNYSDTEQAERIDAEYYQPKYEEIVQAIKSYAGGWGTLGSLVDLKDENFRPVDKTEYKYIELANIAGNGEITGCMIEQGQDLPSRARRKVAMREVIVSSIEGSLDSIALIDEEYDQALCSTGFHVANSQAFNSETFLVLLKSIAGQLQLKKGCSGTILTAINKDEFGKIILPIIAEERQRQIQHKVIESFNLRKQSKHLLECAKRAVEIAIEGDEQTAIDYLKKETQVKDSRTGEVTR